MRLVRHTQGYFSTLVPVINLCIVQLWLLPWKRLQTRLCAPTFRHVLLRNVDATDVFVLRVRLVGPTDTLKIMIMDC